MRTMQNIVLDTNTLIMAISSRGRYFRVWQAFLEGEYTLCVSNEIIEEYLEVISRNINIKVANAVVLTILNRKNVRRIAPHYRFNLIEADVDDNKFVDCAITANARYIVTQDHHFNVLRKISFPIVEVIDIDQFIELISK